MALATDSILKCDWFFKFFLSFEPMEDGDNLVISSQQCFHNQQLKYDNEYGGGRRQRKVLSLTDLTGSTLLDYVASVDSNARSFDHILQT